MSRRHYKVSGGGLLPAGYAECEYIESTGTQYINTGVTANQKTIFSTDFKFMDVMRNYGEGTDNWSANGLRFRYDLVEPVGHQYYGFRIIYNNETKRILTPPDTDWHHIEMKSGLVTLDGVGNSIAQIPSGKISYNIHLFSIITPNGIAANAKMRKSFCKIANDNIQRNYIAALRFADNKPGLYDLCGSICPLTGTPFYVNAGTGEFLYKLK